MKRDLPWEIFREASLPFPKIEKSTTLIIYRSFEATNSKEKLPTTIRQKDLRAGYLQDGRDIPMYFQPTFKNFASVMFCGCIGPNGEGRLVIGKDRIDASSYIAALQNNLLQLTG